MNLTGLRPEGIVEIPASISGSYQLQLISDLGSTIWYNDAIENKDLTESNYRKFLSSVVNVSSTPKPLSVLDLAKSNNALLAYPNPSSAEVTIEFTNGLIRDEVIFIYNIQGQLMKQLSAGKMDTWVSIDISGFDAGMYMVSVPGLSAHVLLSKN